MASSVLNNSSVAVSDPLRTFREMHEQTSLPISTLHQLAAKGVFPVVRMKGVGDRAIIRVRQSVIDAYLAGDN